MGPMFPRLHVNDTEKGGPRAPPRNKMALYEQLCIPSQRFNTGVLPLNPSNTSSSVPPASSSQGSSLERSMHYPSRVTHSTSSNPAEKVHARQLGGATVNAPLAQFEQRKKVRDEDDFMVPVFVSSEAGQQHNITKNGFDGGKGSPSGPAYSGRQIKVQTVRDKDLNRSSSSVVNLRKEVGERSEESSKVCVSREDSVQSAAHLSSRGKIDGLAKEANGSPGQGCTEHVASRLCRSNENDACSLQELRAGRQPANNGCIDGADLIRDGGEGLLPRQRSMSYSEGNQSGPGETNNDSECLGDKTCVSVQWGDGDKSDDVSETSMVDSLSGSDISPDDVVGIIGQKRFWKARRAIVNGIPIVHCLLICMWDLFLSRFDAAYSPIDPEKFCFHGTRGLGAGGERAAEDYPRWISDEANWELFENFKLVMGIMAKGVSSMHIVIAIKFVRYAVKCHFRAKKRFQSWVKLKEFSVGKESKTTPPKHRTSQQRVFAVQVFELHRLIKVQRLIAGSPHVLLEDTAYLSKPSFKGSPARILPPEFIVKPLPHTKLKDDNEKPSHKMECSAENAVGRTSLSSVKNGSQPSNCAPLPGNQPPAPVNGDNRMNHWGFHQMPGHQWLVPVMSPSEGLIYKPYPGPGFMGSVCGGGCGPFGPTPMPGNFMTSGYGVPVPHQGMGVLPGAPPVGHSYFPPYGMPPMIPAVSGSAVEQGNQFAGPGSHPHYGQLSGGGANFNMQQQGSCNLPSEKNGAISHVMKFQASKDTELQGSTASSPGERVQIDRTTDAAEGNNALPLFPTDPAIPEGASQPHETDRRTRVIRVVPHNARSATESAARIFQSIQDERKQHDSV
ncbi:protein EARLY FLOWERING 3-like protein [Corchorus olitorius]|uniref:Protein EARLY FLOWERING 3-like protein n=1 Tax=Corchorus olitorius TaxID=93759 RepID=A0A1R3IVK2_9ROSI|nr:protein EARLY FLOWERING 3-like protein [Corchorus olitorius]